MIHTLLIANRGEIACRIVRTCRKLGIRSAVVYSDVDADSLAVRLADTAVSIGAAPATESYLNSEKIIAAAKRVGADAIHPGFGFLAENPEFAEQCAQAELIFIGPSPEAMATMGNKQAARDLAVEAGVPVLPGYGGVEQSDETFVTEAARIGFPVMVKAAAGGGGKGMRLVHEAGDLAEALAAARREALQAFGSDELILEKALLQPRHVEIQVFGDYHGNVLHLGERECSIQRRHQKIIEESPSPAVDDDLRTRMGETAVSVAKLVNYHNAGTVEFLLDEDGQFYFLEMNTRLQVEHPVTELVTGLDLVAWQIRVAEGEVLPFAQADVQFTGHAIEARVYAEDPANEFLPTTGQILLWREPAGEDVRIDSGMETGDMVTVYYDPMLAKVIAYGVDRKTAVRRLCRAIEQTILFGFPNNLSFLQAALRHSEFMAGNLSTSFIQVHLADWQADAGKESLALIAASLAQMEAYPQLPQNAGFWRNSWNRPQVYRYRVGDDVVEVDVTAVPRRKHQFQITISPEPDLVYDVLLNELDSHEMVLTVDGWRRTAVFAQENSDWWVQIDTALHTFQSMALLPEPQALADVGGSLRAPMPGSVIEVLVEVGQTVMSGQALLKLEAMKMEHTIRSAGDGVVTEIYFAVGDAVEADAQLLQIQSGDLHER